MDLQVRCGPAGGLQVVVDVQVRCGPAGGLHVLVDVQVRGGLTDADGLQVGKWNYT